MSLLKSLFTLGLCIYICTNSHVYAQEFSSKDYRIESGSIEIEPILTPLTDSYDQSFNLGIEAQKKFKEKGYAAISRESASSSGRAYIRLQIPYTQLLFSEAEIADESIRQNLVRLSGDSPTQLMLMGNQEGKFKNDFGAVILSTLCDKKNSPCTPTHAQQWTNTPGFGYRINNSIYPDMQDPRNYRPMFISETYGQTAILFSGKALKEGVGVDLRFKLRPEPKTQTGLYKTTIVITAMTDY